VARELSASLGNTELLAYLVDHRNQWHFAWGSTYLGGLLLPVPRALWHAKPVGGGPYLINIVHPGSYVVGRKFNTSYTTGAPLEAYMNLGILGVLIVGGLHGVGLGLVGRYGRSVRNSYQCALYILLLLMVTEELVYGEFAMALGRSGTMIVPVVAVAVFLRAAGVSAIRREPPLAITTQG
jgi:hypothetical protein